MASTRSLVAALLAGVAVAVLGTVLAEFVSGPERGHRINTASLPAEARTILAERPGVPVSAEQWSRLDRVMSRHGGWPGGSQVFAASVRHSWYWYVALPLLVLVFARRLVPITLPVVGLVAGPSMLVVAFAFAGAVAPGLQ